MPGTRVCLCLSQGGGSRGLGASEETGARRKPRPNTDAGSSLCGTLSPLAGAHGTMHGRGSPTALCHPSLDQGHPDTSEILSLSGVSAKPRPNRLTFPNTELLNGRQLCPSQGREPLGRKTSCEDMPGKWQLGGARRQFLKTERKTCC